MKWTLLLLPALAFAQFHRADHDREIRYWLLDPATRKAYTVTPNAGLQEFKGDVLRTEDPVLELPLTKVFA